MKQLRAWLPTSKLSYKPAWFQVECVLNGGESPWFNLFRVNSKIQREHPIITAAKLTCIKLHQAGCWDFFKSPLAPMWNNKRILIGREPIDWPPWFTLILIRLLPRIICHKISFGDVSNCVAHYLNG